MGETGDVDIKQYTYVPPPQALQVQEPGRSGPRTCTFAVFPSFRHDVFILAPVQDYLLPPYQKGPLLLVVLLCNLYIMYYSPTGPQLLQFACIEILYP